MNFDQRMAEIRDSMPRMCWAIYGGSVDAGFTTDQAFALTQTFLLGLAAVRLSSVVAAPTDNPAPEDA